MTSLGLTGGIATGKSTASELLAEQLACRYLSADRIVHELLERDDSTRQAVIARFGLDCCQNDGKLDRKRLRDIVFNDSTARRDLESILHPRVRSTWRRALAEERDKQSPFFLVEIPLLFEVDAQNELDRTILVGCSEAIQIQRLKEKRNLSAQDAQKIIDSQMPLVKKIELSDHVLWNDGPRAALEMQVRRLAKHLSRKDFFYKSQ